MALAHGNVKCCACALSTNASARYGQGPSTTLDSSAPQFVRALSSVNHQLANQSPGMDDGYFDDIPYLC